ncbi:MAG TPA: sugar ABC transporter permease [Methylomirabilota bacterium]|jgi:multiple sugar transport system permease protein|nr:sugar ABC transporter permease [Methylomirabilota bacterium]
MNTGTSTTAVAVAPPLGAGDTIRRSDRRLGVVMLLPTLLYIALLVALPFLLALFLSLTNSSAGSLDFSFVGLQNFKNVVKSPVFRRALVNTFVFTLVSQLTVLVLGNILARALMKRFFGKSIARFLILMPWAAPISLATLGWLWIFDSTFSVVNWLLKVVGWLGPGQWYYWLGDTTLGMAAIITIHVWRMLPFSTVILLAGLTSIPNEVREAAAIDGAGTLARIFQVEIPMMKPILIVAVLFGVVFTFTDMSVVYLLTRGGPYNSTHVLASLAFQDGVLGGDVGRGASVAIFLVPVLLVLAIVMLRASRRAEVL